ncbi:MAG TPA: ABC transporter permease [Vicinamibacterales bacterium]|nr:ABC transporter permease [Vicinamibacterales bacterium]
MSEALQPPRWSGALLRRASRRLRTPDLADDAAEIFAEIAGREGARAARRWYRRQARAALARALFDHRRPRVSRRSGWPRGLQFDVKLGTRMLLRYPGLTFVAGLAIAFAIFVGAALFEFIAQTLPGSHLPLPHGERVVGLRYRQRTQTTSAPLRPGDLSAWRDEIASIEKVGAFRTVTRNLIGEDGADAAVETAVMSAAGFELAATPPALGRVLIDADAARDAPPVVVLGHRVWRSRFHADPAIVGRAVRIDGVQTTIVGVMPEGFGFPIAHDLWMPLRLDDASDDAIAGLKMFGRLKPDATIDIAQAEIDALTRRRAISDPARYANLIGQVQHYRESLFERPITLMFRVVIMQLNVFAALFLMLVAANVGLLMFARAAGRERELAVRSALGAGRARIVTQFFVEALVLAATATTVGLAAVGPGLEWLSWQIIAMGGGHPPFWFRTAVSGPTALYSAGLALFAAVVAGVPPALKATGRGLQPRLAQGSGSGGLRFGGTWSAVVITQIAATVVFTAGALLMVRQAQRSGSMDVRFPAGEYLTFQVSIDDGKASGESYATMLRELQRRLGDAGGVSGVAIADRLPLMVHPSRGVEVDSGDASAIVDGAPADQEVSLAAVDDGFFDVFGAPIVAGRRFDASDNGSNARTVIVDTFFVEQILGGRNAVGRRIRFTDWHDPDAPPAWHTIVGVVRDLETDRPGSLHLDEPPMPVVYRPLFRNLASDAVRVAIHATGHDRLRSTLQRTASAVNPSLRVQEVGTLDDIASGEVAFWRFWAKLIFLVSSVAMTLSLAGIYAVMSFTVARRTREIGVRVALGGRAPRIIAEILRGPIAQVAGGIAAGCVLVFIMLWTMTARPMSMIDLASLLGLGAAMTIICTLAGLGPMRRALRVQPADALHVEQ